MGKIKDLTGQKFGRLTVIKFAEIRKNKAYWECLCDCGKICIRNANSLTVRKEEIKSCGCFNIELNKRLGQNKIINLVGQKFGRLTIIKYAYTKNNRAFWECICDCGNKCIKNGIFLRKGETKSCGCLVTENANVQGKKGGIKNRKNLIGKKFGRLTVLEYKGKSKFGSCNWLCMCDCGKEHIATTNHLTMKNTTSCGCYGKEQTIKNVRKDLTGQKFGKLTVIEYSHTKDFKAFWKCQCDCGKTSIISSHCLLNKKTGTKSCGCTISHGNDKISNILTLLNIDFKKEKIFKNCFYIKPLRFDFYITNYNLLIEYQGKHHYKTIQWGKDYFEKVRIRDQIKRDFCKQEGIELLEICYKDYDKIEEILREKLNIPKNEVQ